MIIKIFLPPPSGGDILDRKERQMKKSMGLGAVLLAGFLVIPGNLGLAGPVLAQTNPQTTEELRQKRLETLQEQEREAAQEQDVGKRKQDALKRQQDAIKRQKAVEKSMQELEKEGK
jgi:hypothetical protein